MHTRTLWRIFLWDYCNWKNIRSQMSFVKRCNSHWSTSTWHFDLVLNGCVFQCTVLKNTKTNCKLLRSRNDCHKSYDRTYAATQNGHWRGEKKSSLNVDFILWKYVHNVCNRATTVFPFLVHCKAAISATYYSATTTSASQL